MSGSPIVVSGIPDANYDLILYESLFPNGGTGIAMDQIIIGVSNSTDGSYYEVFNWGDNVRDTNSNVDTNGLVPDPGCAGSTAPECDNRMIPSSSLYTSSPGTPGTGILIDVDTANGAPPEGTYNFLVIISPVTIPLIDNAQVDSLQVAEVPLPPTPPPPTP
jgi:hypothetical protein